MPEKKKYKIFRSEIRKQIRTTSLAVRANYAKGHNTLLAKIEFHLIHKIVHLIRMLEVIYKIYLLATSVMKSTRIVVCGMNFGIYSTCAILSARDV